jgi:hypothetical protein
LRAFGDHETPGLGVAAGRRQAGRFQAVNQGFVLNRPVGKVAAALAAQTQVHEFFHKILHFNNVYNVIPSSIMAKPSILSIFPYKLTGFFP